MRQTLRNFRSDLRPEFRVLDAVLDRLRRNSFLVAMLHVAAGEFVATTAVLDCSKPFPFCVAGLFEKVKH